MSTELKNLLSLRNGGSKTPGKNPSHIYQAPSMALKDRKHLGYHVVKKALLSRPDHWHTLSEVERAVSHAKLRPTTLGKLLGQLLADVEIETQQGPSRPLQPVATFYRAKEKPGFK